MQTIRRATLFLASPGDVAQERRSVRDIVAEFNRTVGRDKRLDIDVVCWETDASPEYGADPQSIINRQVADMSQCDLFVGILWNRFGTPTPRFGSGTEEEFSRAVDAWRKSRSPRIMLYFSDALSVLNTNQAQERSKVLHFRDSLSGSGLLWRYGSVESFTSEFRRHLFGWAIKL